MYQSDKEKVLKKLVAPEYTLDLLNSSDVTIAKDIEDLYNLTFKYEENGSQKVSYHVPGKGNYVEVIVNKVKNGISANYTEPYMRRRDPDSMLIGDDLPTDKTKYEKEFSRLRKETFDWLKSQKLAIFFFKPGQIDIDNVYGMAISPDNSGFFCMGLGLLQGIINPFKISDNDKMEVKCIIYVAPPLRHTHFNGKQRVVHYRSENCHEIFSYNLYPGPSAKKGVYSALLDIGEKEGWLTNHAAVVQVVTPYGNKICIMHEGASGGGKSETHENIHRELDGTVKMAENIYTEEKLSLVLSRGCILKPVVDDMALSHPKFQKNDGFLYTKDAEHGWFIRVNHIKDYGTDPDMESLSIHPTKPLLFLNIDAPAYSTALLWEHIEDEPGVPCPNPRFIVEREQIEGIVDKPVKINIRSFGVRTPPTSKDRPGYGILGLFHILPPAIAWLWRLVSPRGHDNPSIVKTSDLASEGVGSYWPFATGKRITHANLLLKQILETPNVKYVLVPNQYIGAWKVGFNPQWIMREFFARRGGVKFLEEELKESSCPLLGYSVNKIVIEGVEIEKFLLQPEIQPEVGTDVYKEGCNIIEKFFKTQLEKYYIGEDILPLGKKIIDCYLSNGKFSDYLNLIEIGEIFIEE